MTFANILIYLVLIVFVLARKVRGQSIDSPKKLLALPVIVTVIGYGDLTHGAMKPLDVTLTVIGAALSLGLGLLRGRADRLSTRDGAPFVQWGVASLILFFTNVAVKLVLDVVGVAAGDTFSAAGKSLVFTLGLTLLGEAVVLWLRSGSAGLLPRTGDAPAMRAQDRAAECAPPTMPSWVPRQEAGLRLFDVQRFLEERHDSHHRDHHHEHHAQRGD